MESYCYSLGQKDAFYGRKMCIHSHWSNISRQAYRNGYADYCESFA